MNLPSLKSAAEKAKTSPLELEIWQMEIEPDDVLRLVEALRSARDLLSAFEGCSRNNFASLAAEEVANIDALGKIE
jgi:hypothetical protein